MGSLVKNLDFYKCADFGGYLPTLIFTRKTYLQAGYYYLEFLVRMKPEGSQSWCLSKHIKTCTISMPNGKIIPQYSVSII